MDNIDFNKYEIKNNSIQININDYIYKLYIHTIPNKHICLVFEKCNDKIGYHRNYYNCDEMHIFEWDLIEHDDRYIADNMLKKYKDTLLILNKMNIK